MYYNVIFFVSKQLTILKTDTLLVVFIAFAAHKNELINDLYLFL
jgi:hypothetical protein